MTDKAHPSLFSFRPFGDLSADESAELKQLLKKQPVSDELRLAAEIHVCEATEAICEVEDGHDFAVSGSWVSEVVV